MDKNHLIDSLDYGNSSSYPYFHKSQSEAYQKRLKQMILNYQQQIKSNIPVIEQLSKQSKVYKKICIKQKEKLEKNSNSAIKILAEEYQNQLEELHRQKIKLHQMVSDCQQTGNATIHLNKETLKQLSNNQQFLNNNIQNLQQQNQTYKKVLKDKKAILQAIQRKAKQNLQQLSQKQNVENKYLIVLNAIKAIQRQKQLNKLGNSTNQRVDNQLKFDFEQ